MKKCEYCGKEISYHEQYCDVECQKKALDFYELREKYTNIFSIINCICMFGIPIGIFLFSFHKPLGFTVSAISLIILGLTVMLLPFPTENMLSKRKIMASVKFAKILGIGILAVGLICLVIDFIFFI